MALMNRAKKGGENEDLAKASRSEITLDELDDLYRSEEAEKEAELASKRLMMASHSNLVTSIKVNSATPPPVVRMRYVTICVLITTNHLRRLTGYH